jgi:hypothetical protein
MSNKLKAGSWLLVTTDALNIYALVSIDAQFIEQMEWLDSLSMLGLKKVILFTDACFITNIGSILSNLTNKQCISLVKNHYIFVTDMPSNFYYALSDVVEIEYDFVEQHLRFVRIDGSRKSFAIRPNDFYTKKRKKA